MNDDEDDDMSTLNRPGAQVRMAEPFNEEVLLLVDSVNDFNNLSSYSML